jgi:hypothetical protein
MNGIQSGEALSPEIPVVAPAFRGVWIRSEEFDTGKVRFWPLKRMIASFIAGQCLGR